MDEVKHMNVIGIQIQQQIRYRNPNSATNS